MAEAKLRATTVDDAPAIIALMKNLKEWFGVDVWDEVAADRARCEGMAVVDDTGEMKGFVLWLREGETCVIKWLGVVKELHRHGIVRRMVEGMIERVREQGVTRLSVDTLAPTHDYEPYARTRAFYEACGFQLDRIEPHGFSEHEDKAVYRMALA